MYYEMVKRFCLLVWCACDKVSDPRCVRQEAYNDHFPRAPLMPTPQTVAQLSAVREKPTDRLRHCRLPKTFLALWITAKRVH